MCDYSGVRNCKGIMKVHERNNGMKGTINLHERNNGMKGTMKLTKRKIGHLIISSYVSNV